MTLPAQNPASFPPKFLDFGRLDPTVRFAALALMLACGESALPSTETSATPQDSGNNSEADGDEGQTDDAETESDESTHSESSDSSDGSGFVELDAGGDCEGPPPCEPADDFACSEGQKCTVVDCDGSYDAWEIFRCVDLVGDAMPGEPCEFLTPNGAETCDLDARCAWPDEMTGIGICVSFCRFDNGSFCEDGLGCFSKPNDELTQCLPLCDPDAPECGEGEACIAGIVEGVFVCRPED